jgi:hypothetical protein
MTDFVGNPNNPVESASFLAMQDITGGTCAELFANTLPGCTSIREFCACGSTKLDAPATGWWMIESVRHTNPSNYWGTQVAHGWKENAGNMFERTIEAGVWSNWREVILANNSGNILLNTNSDNGVDKLQVNGSISTAQQNGYITECGGFLPIIGDTSPSMAGASGSIATITDLNKLTRSGTYNGHDLANAPTGGWIFVRHMQHSNIGSNVWAQQIVTTMGASNTANQAYIRTNVGGTWSQWYKFWHSGNGGSGSGLAADTVDGLHIGQSGVNYIPYANASGNVLVGTTTDNGVDKLQVAGTISEASLSTISVDLNTLHTVTKKYAVDSNSSNLPISSEYFYVEVIALNNGTWCMQRATAIGVANSSNGGRVFSRVYMSASTWSSWKELTN